jgi:hypothetical protein
MENIEKKPFYKRKVMMFPVALLLVAGMVYAATLIFHQADVTISVGEARYSADGTFAFSCLSGETYTQNANIYNYANVALYADVAYSEVSNVPTNLSNPNVEYTVTLPTMPVLLTSKNWTVVPVEVHCSEVSSAGSASGVLTYSNAPTPTP